MFLNVDAYRRGTPEISVIPEKQCYKSILVLKLLTSLFQQKKNCDFCRYGVTYNKKCRTAKHIIWKRKKLITLNFFSCTACKCSHICITLKHSRPVFLPIRRSSFLCFERFFFVLYQKWYSDDDACGGVSIAFSTTWH